MTILPPTLSLSRSLYLAKLFLPPLFFLSLSNPQEGEEVKKKGNAVGEECAEPTVFFFFLISRCHGLAFPSPQSCYHATAYRCREAKVSSAPSPLLPLPLLMLMLMLMLPPPPPLPLPLLPSHSFGHRLFAPAL